MFTFNSTRDMGSMSGKSKFYKNKTKEEIKKDLLERRKKLGDYFGFYIPIFYRSKILYFKFHFYNSIL